uniref:Uncharacterized protein n=1 Tax=Panstrongylus lignarius TaxID=156445 RepID=A0A224Y4Z2_9HEMI
MQGLSLKATSLIECSILLLRISVPTAAALTMFLVCSSFNFLFTTCPSNTRHNSIGNEIGFSLDPHSKHGTNGYSIS